MYICVKHFGVANIKKKKVHRFPIFWKLLCVASKYLTFTTFITFLIHTATLLVEQSKIILKAPGSTGA